jgi:putative acyl-CoA dehydrogenase
MQNVLTDLAIESEASTFMALRMALAYDGCYNDSYELVNCSNRFEAQELFRIGVTVSKYYVTKRLPHFAYECMEQMGGNGFVEEFPMARLFRHSPLNSIWEGSGNVIALDILRGAKALPILLQEISLAKGMDSKFDQMIQGLEQSIRSLFRHGSTPKHLLSDENQRTARNLIDRLGLAMQGSILLRMSDPIVAKAFLESRIYQKDNMGINYGGTSIFTAQDCKHILDRNLPVFY